MRAWRIRVLIGLIVGAGLLFSSCGLLSDPTVKLLTSHAEMAAYAERYNAVQDKFKVEVQFSDSPFQSVLDGEQADIVIGEWLSTPRLLDRFDYTSDIVKPGRIDPSWFYPELLSMGSRDSRPMLVPISFDLPAVVFSAASTGTATASSIPPMFISLELMRSLSAKFNTKGKNGYLAMGFSPLWNAGFLSEMSAAFGTRFRAGRDGMPVWETEGLTRTADFLRGWLSQINGGTDIDAAFKEKQLVLPFYKLLAAKKILFTLYPFTAFFSLDEEVRRGLDFRWLSESGIVHAMEDVVFGGILRIGRNTRGGRDFLEWLISPSTQRDLLDVVQSKRIAVFGVMNGFSSLKAINEKELGAKYPMLLGHIPTDNLLRFPQLLPDNWVKVRDEVIQPWLIAAASGVDIPDLAQRLEEWRNALSIK
jgi:hypothetical protein